MLQEFDNILIYDGYCYLCSNTARLILYCDRGKKISFADQEYLNSRKKEFKNIDLNSVIFIHQQRIYYKSEALEMICKVLGGGFKIFLVFKIIPLGFRNYLYDIVSRNRYRLFGKRKLCHIFSSKYKDRLVKR